MSGMSRRQKLLRANRSLKDPEIGFLLPVAEMLYAVGPVKGNHPDYEAMTWADIRDWAQVCEIPMTPEQAQFIYKGSRAYLQGVKAFFGVSSVPPDAVKEGEAVDQVSKVLHKLMKGEPDD